MDTGAFWLDDDERLRLRCMQVAENDIEQFNELYRRTRYSEVCRLHMLQAAASWRPQRGDDTTSGART